MRAYRLGTFGETGNSMDIKLFDITQRRTEMLVGVGQAWVRALPDNVQQALDDYELRPVDSLPGGSAS